MVPRVLDRLATRLYIRGGIEARRNGMGKLSLAFVAAALTFWSCSPSVTVHPRVYSTDFPLVENPISENENWLNGFSAGVVWHDVVTAAGVATGTPSPEAWSDPTAVLTGEWAPDQEVEAVVHSVKPTETYYQEVEIRLRSRISPHEIAGYEILFRCLKTSSAYMAIVRWNGPLGDFTYLSIKRGAQYGVAHGDVVKASIVGSEIKVYINEVLVDSVAEGTFKTGNPGMGFNFGCGPTYGDFGFSEFTAAEVVSPVRRR
jgi:hypothetical protein